MEYNIHCEPPKCGRYILPHQTDINKLEEIPHSEMFQHTQNSLNGLRNSE